MVFGQMTNKEQFEFCSQFKIKHEIHWFELKLKSEAIQFENPDEVELFVASIYEAARTQFGLE